MTSILLSTIADEIWQNVIAVYNSRPSLSSLKEAAGRTWRLQAVDRRDAVRNANIKSKKRQRCAVSEIQICQILRLENGCATCVCPPRKKNTMHS